MGKLPGDYIAGFVDGEGCFALKFRRDVRHDRVRRSGIKPVYFYWTAEFAILLRSDDKKILEEIKDTLRCGSISNNRNGAFARYSVQNIPELNNKIIPFFEKYQLHAKKKFDFKLWKEAVKILMENRQKDVKRKENQKGFLKIDWNPKDLNRLLVIKKEMETYKSTKKPWKWLPTV